MTITPQNAPGLYVIETDALPQTVGVQTAIPAFIGYTEKAEFGGKTVAGQPIKISSLADYEKIFGASIHLVYDLEEVPQPNAVTFASDGLPQLNPPAEAYDFSCARKDAAAPSGWTVKFYRLSLAAPVPTTKAKPSPLAPFLLANALRLFYANGGRDCYVVSAGHYVEAGKPVTIAYAPLKKALDNLANQSGPTMLAIPDAVLLPPPQKNEGPASSDFYRLCRDMLEQCAALGDRVAILDVYGAETLDQHDADWTKRVAALAADFHVGVGEKFLPYGVAYFPFLTTSVVTPDDIDYSNFNSGDDEQRALLLALLNDQAEFQYWGEPVKQEMVKGYVAQIESTPADGVKALNQTLVTALPLFRQMEDIVAQKAQLLPPSAAIPAVYTFNDTARGVWNAPANIALTSVTSPNVKLNDAQQADLNLPDDGKSINVVRQFVGRGPVVWGARTLDGRGNDWRYIQVRRLLIYIEQSIKAALDPFVFAKNDGPTWTAIISIASGFLRELWAQGGLLGDKPSDAFSVACGLGSTMTAQDIQDGYLIVQVTVQATRPAEFIELTFRQKMQGPA